MRVLVTGSRDWEDDEVIFTQLDHLLCDAYRKSESNLVLVHGACRRGADAMADLWWLEMRGTDDGYFSYGEMVELERDIYPADWAKLGKQAGHARNAQMVDRGADICLAFIRNNSPGATNCASLAAKAGIPLRIFREDTNYAGEFIARPTLAPAA